MTANSDKSKQDNKAAHRVLAGVLCGASVLSLVLSLVMPPISQAIASDTQTVFTEETVRGGGSSSDSAAVGNTSEDAENQNSTATSASAAATVNKGIYKPTPIGIGTKIDVSTPDTGVATYVGRDMYIGGKPSVNRPLDADNAPTGSYAVEAEGLTVVRGKLAMNPLKESWPYNGSGAGFRFGTVGFGSQFRPVAGSTVLAVAGIDSAITSMSVGYSGDTPQATTVGAWNKGAWVGHKNPSGGATDFAYTAQIAGPITYWRDNNERQSVVTTQGNWYEGENSQESNLFNQTVDLTNVNNNDYSSYNGEDGYLSKLSKRLNSFAINGKVNAEGFAEPKSEYDINKYNNDGTSYKLKFDGENKSVSGALDTGIPNNTICNTERLITFTGDGTSMQQVFTIDGSDLSNLKDGVYYRGVDFNFDNIPKGASVIVNVTGKAPIEFHNGWRFWWNGGEISRGYENNSAVKTQYSTAAQSIMWNFMDTTSLTIRGGIAGEGRKDWGGSDDKWTDDDPAAAMIGSILVPNGSFDDHVTTNGRVYVGEDFMMNNPKEAYNFTNLEGSSASVIDMDQERHNFPWSGSYTPDGSSIAWSKIDAGDSTLLAGSAWAVYGSVENAVKGTNAIVTVTDGGANDYASDAGELQFNYLNQKADPSKEISDSNPAFIYYIKEVTAPAGYQKSDKIYYATMKKTGETVNYVQGYVDTAKGNSLVPFDSSKITGAIPNTKITGTVSWTKVGDGDAKYAPLAGSEWKLAKLGADGSTEEKSWTVSDRSTASEVTWEDSDDAPGKFTLEGLLPGTYTLVETQAPLGYNLNNTVYKFTVSNENGSTTWAEDKKLTVDKGGNAYISDSLATTSVTIPVTKSVRNTDWPKDPSGKKYVAFDFSIEATGPNKDSAPKPDPKLISVAPADSTKVNDIEASFGEISFSKEQLVTNDALNPTGAKTYTYTVKEVAPTAGAIDKLRYSKAEYQVAVTVKAATVDGKRSGLTTSTTVTQMKDDMGNALGEKGQGVKVQPSADAPANAIPASTFTNVKVLTDLPLTGAGWTENSMLLVGAGLMLLGGIAAGAYWFATKRRQDDPSDGAGR